MNDAHASTDRDRSLLSRRTLFGAGGVVSLGILAAACGGESSGEGPGRVGNAPTPTPLPNEDELDDVLLLRTAASVELTIVGLYEDIRALDVLDSELSTTLDEFVRRHESNADRINELVESDGGEAWTCANPWLVDRFTGPIVELIAGTENDNPPPSDDQTRDAFNTLTSFENLAGATYQQLVAALSTPERRQTAAELAAGSVRRGSFLAYTATGTPDGYVHPEISGAPPEEEESEDGAEGDAAAEDEGGSAIAPVYAMTERFGSLAAVTLTVGAADQDGARQSFMLETPADNSYIYSDSECPPSQA